MVPSIRTQTGFGIGAIGGDAEGELTAAVIPSPNRLARSGVPREGQRPSFSSRRGRTGAGTSPRTSPPCAADLLHQAARHVLERRVAGQEHGLEPRQVPIHQGHRQLVGEVGAGSAGPSRPPTRRTPAAVVDGQPPRRRPSTRTPGRPASDALDQLDALRDRRTAPACPGCPRTATTTSSNSPAARRHHVDVPVRHGIEAARADGEARHGPHPSSGRPQRRPPP